MAHWWVNQNQSHEHEVHEGYRWSPKRKADGARNEFYDNMTKVWLGDIVFSYYRAAIRAVGVVTGQCREAPYPREVGSQRMGWSVPVEFTELQSPELLTVGRHFGDGRLLPGDRLHNMRRRAAIACLVACLLVIAAAGGRAETIPPRSTDNGTVRFYGPDGRYQGSADTKGTRTGFYGPDGRSQGSATTTGNRTTFYGPDGRYQGSADRSGEPGPVIHWPSQ
jgi:hypothetical protein